MTDYLGARTGSYLIRRLLGSTDERVTDAHTCARCANPYRKHVVVRVEANAGERVYVIECPGRMPR